MTRLLDGLLVLKELRLLLRIGVNAAHKVRVRRVDRLHVRRSKASYTSSLRPHTLLAKGLIEYKCGSAELIACTSHVHAALVSAMEALLQLGFYRLDHPPP